MSERNDAGEEAAPNMGPARLINACGYSLAGLASAWRTEGAFRQEVIAAAILIPIACWAPVTMVERVLLIASVLFVMMIELLNCSIEAAVDRISLERHPLAKRAKDTGSAAVLLSLVIGATIWVLILGPVLLRMAGY
jgi:diacylglycerol kinase (ATP)